MFKQCRLISIGALVADIAVLAQMISVSPFSPKDVIDRLKTMNLPGLDAADVIGILNINVPYLDDDLQTSVHFLSVAIPTLIYVIIAIEWELHYQVTSTPVWAIYWPCAIGASATGGAFCSIFTHFLNSYCWVFLIISAIGMALLLWQVKGHTRL